ncbi:MAG: uroporphyrinogen-III synthase [Rhodospirillaceae bacterium]
MRVLVTRPQPDADATAAELTARGHTPIVAPLLDISMSGDAVVDLDGAQAVLITSANGARALARVTDRRDIPVFAVGDASAAAARAGGFARTESASGDVETLAALVAERLAPADGRLVHLAGTVTAGDLSGSLTAAGFTVDRAVVYRAEVVHEMPAIVAEALDSRTLDAAMFFSPRTAARFVELAAREGLDAACSGTVALALSSAVAENLGPVPFADVRVADAPDQASLLRALDAISQ